MTSRWLLVLGLALAAYFLFVYKPVVAAPSVAPATPLPGGEQL